MTAATTNALDWFQAVAAVAAVLTFWVYFLLLRASHRASLVSTALEIWDRLEASAAKAARRKAGTPKDRDLKAWLSDEISAADETLRVFLIAANYWMDGALPQTMLERYYGRSIVYHWDNLQPYVADQRERGNPSWGFVLEQFVDHCRRIMEEDPEFDRRPPKRSTLRARVITSKILGPRSGLRGGDYGA